jgi:hypothetical protein
MRRGLLAILLLFIAGTAAGQSGPVLRSNYSGSASGIAGVHWSELPGVSWYRVRRTYTFPNNWYMAPQLVTASSHSYAEFFNGPENTVVYQVIPTDASGVQIAPASNYAMVSKHAYAAPLIAGQTLVASSRRCGRRRP